MAAALSSDSAACVLPELVGPTCATTLRRIIRAAGYQDAGEVRSVRWAALWAASKPSSASGGGATASSEPAQNRAMIVVFWRLSRAARIEMLQFSQYGCFKNAALN